MRGWMRTLVKNRWVQVGLAGAAWALAGWGWMELQAWLLQFGVRFTLPPLLAAPNQLALWPWEQAVQLWPGERAEIYPWPWTYVLPWLLPLALGAAVLAAAAFRLLWDGVQPRRWIAWVLIALLVVPNFVGAWRREAVMQRLFPPGAHIGHRKELPSELSLRYTDLSPFARQLISQEEFDAWQTWNDVADSFQKVPHRIGRAYMETRYHMEPREGWGEANAFIDFHPLTGQIRQFDLVRDPIHPLVGAQIIKCCKEVELEIINRWAHPIELRAIRAVLPPEQSPYELVVGRRLDAKEKVVLTLDWAPPSELSDRAEQIAFEIEWIALPLPRVEIYRPFTPRDR